MIHPSTPGAGDREGGEPLAKTLGGAARLKERPILFSAPMVRALLDGRKTQTRRIVKPQPVGGDSIISKSMEPGWMVGQLRDSENAWRDLRCPYGQPGDRLWVRESFLHIAHGEMSITDDYESWYGGEGCQIEYAADGAKPRSLSRNSWMVKRPSIHMPRWASRLTLEVTGVRVERLQDITEEDARSEGADYWVTGHGPVSTADLQCEPGYWGQGSYKTGFWDLWESINGAGSWDLNPWVWVVEFKANSARSAPEASSPKGPLPATPEVTP